MLCKNCFRIINFGLVTIWPNANTDLFMEFRIISMYVCICECWRIYSGYKHWKTKHKSRYIRYDNKDLKPKLLNEWTNQLFGMKILNHTLYQNNSYFLYLWSQINYLYVRFDIEIRIKVTCLKVYWIIITITVQRQRCEFGQSM